jgi:succinate dehydrogenase/fumarate reductase flavoprotein subunit
MVEGINFCCGGFRTTTSMQVVDVFGGPVPGLYAAGDTVGGLNPVSDLGGVHICGGLTLGRVAGRAAARGDSDTGDHGTVLHAGMPSMLDTRIALVHLDRPAAGSTTN